MQRLGYPFPLFLDQHGGLIDAGKIYVGAAEADPELSPIQVYWDTALTVPAAQPLRTRGGMIVRNGAPAVAFVAETDYSMRVRDADGSQVSYAATATDAVAVSYQPASNTLDLLAALSTTSFGRSLLSLADVNALKALVAVSGYLSTTGGTVSGNILRQGGGPHLYFNDAALTSGRVFLTAVGASDPTSAPGDIWAKY